MRRREFITLLGGAAAAWPISARAQQSGQLRRIGVLMPTAESDPESKLRLATFLQALQVTGWVQGRNLTVELRYADGKLNRLPELAAELVNSKVDVILTTGTESVQAAQKATTTIPIVMATIGDPVAIGVIASLARPGGNVTGLSLMATDLTAKRLELSKEILPTLNRMAVLWNPNNASVVLKFKELEAAARAASIQFMSVEVRQASDLEPGFAALSRWGAEVIVTADETLLVSTRIQIASLAMRYRLPMMSEFSVLAAAGGFLSYGPHVLDLWRRSAGYVDKILKGTKPADIPVEQPTRFYLVINLKTAKAIGLTVPPMLLARADEVIE
jgi:putative tryptophan/tyrosine transport system substrate-binding protein